MDVINQKLGNTGIEISPMGLGLMQWGSVKLLDPPGVTVNAEIRQVFTSTLDAGINFFDTAEMYGNGRSEINLRACLRDKSAPVIIATKFMPFPWRLSKNELNLALRNSLKRLGLNQIDLYQMHWPFPPLPIQSWMEAMSDAVEEGLIRAVGVSNYSPKQTQIAYDALAKRNIPLASNQVKFNLLDHRPERNGLVELCKQLGVTLIAYSPLEVGILTGKYHRDNPPRGILAWRYNTKRLIKIQPMIDVMRRIGESRGGLTPAAVALNWLMCKGAVPIPGARNVRQARENATALGWALSAGEVGELDSISERIS